LSSPATKWRFAESLSALDVGLACAGDPAKPANAAAATTVVTSILECLVFVTTVDTFPCGIRCWICLPRDAQAKPPYDTTGICQRRVIRCLPLAASPTLSGDQRSGVQGR